MLRQRCPRTGVINVFTDADPLLAIGSIVQIGQSKYVWRSHIDESVLVSRGTCPWPKRTCTVRSVLGLLW
jgi:hypothetical protein